MVQQTHLQLDRSISNLAFESWRLSSGLVTETHTFPLPSPTYSPCQTLDTDYVHARNTAFHNALLNQPAATYLCLRAPAQLEREEDAVQFCRVDVSPTVSIRPLLTLLPPLETTIPALLDPPLLPTVVEVARQPAPPATPEASTPEASTRSSPRHQLLLASRGGGEVHLARCSATETDGSGERTCTTSPEAFYPLRPEPPLQGNRAFQLVTAMEVASDSVITAIVWAVARRPTDAVARCEIYALTFSILDNNDGSGCGGGGLSLLHVQLLLRSSLPPHGASCNPSTRSILLAVEPLDEEAEEEEAAEHIIASAGGHPEQGPRGIQPHHRHDDALIDDGDDAVSPRTLREAAARLAHLTSEEYLEPSAAVPRHQYADIFKETGPDGVDGMGKEPACTLVAYRAKVPCQGNANEETAASSPTRVIGEHSSSTQCPTFVCVEKLACQPHRVLGCQVSGAGFRLALTDDVDCAVIEVQPVSSDDALEEPSQRSGASDREEEGNNGYSATSASTHYDSPDHNPDASTARAVTVVAGGFSVRHAASVPALAYVAAGKLQRKFFVSAPVEARVAAALVEAQRYAYVYGKTRNKDDRMGEQQLIEISPDRGNEGIVKGAAFVCTRKENRIVAGGDSQKAKLLILTQDCLTCFEM